MWPDADEPEFWDDEPDGGLDPEDDEESDPEPGDFYFDVDPADDQAGGF